MLCPLTPPEYPCTFTPLPTWLSAHLSSLGLVQAHTPFLPRVQQPPTPRTMTASTSPPHLPDPDGPPRQAREAAVPRPSWANHQPPSWANRHSLLLSMQPMLLHQARYCRYSCIHAHGWAACRYCCSAKPATASTATSTPMGLGSIPLLLLCQARCCRQAHYCCHSRIHVHGAGQHAAQLLQL